MRFCVLVNSVYLILTFTSAPLNSVKNESTSKGFSTSCRKISSESLHSGSSELRSHELPGISWFWLFDTFTPVASCNELKHFTQNSVMIFVFILDKGKPGAILVVDLCTCKHAEISTIRPSLSGHQSSVSSINGIPVVALPLRREVFDAASVSECINPP